MTFHAITAVPLSIVTALGLLGNVLTLATTALHPLKTSMNTLMLNLALCDLLFEALDCVPMTAYTAQSRWPFSIATCKAHNYFRTITVYVSAYTLLFMCTDRLLTLWSPNKDRHRNYVAAVVWLWVVVAIGACYTFSITRLTSPPHAECTLAPGTAITRMHYLAKFALAFCVPVALSGVCVGVSCCLGCRYEQQYRHYTACETDVQHNSIAASRVHLMLAPRQRYSARGGGDGDADDRLEVRRMTITVSTILVISTLFWLPNYVMELLMIYEPAALARFGMQESYWLTGVSLCLAYFIPAARPLVYFILLPTFRQQCYRTVLCTRQRQPQHYHVNSFSPVHQTPTAAARETTV
ncbi:PREDICTED: neuropeptide Y receptor-like [Priapulus caudatus]|uniref:Neuropeptide Y receptor-like n=1 Tax=Priapulus caudatus TaxID=37621 RepID=A0ABM1EVW9_PRICU|nr:PREDICTED: neuropeptide Y receptor-like [Priapulus caudatus]